MTVILTSPIHSLPSTPIHGGLSLEDASLAARRGVRGRHAADHLRDQGLTVPPVPNQIVASGDDQWVMALSRQEFWIINPQQLATAAMPDSTAIASEVWPLYCQHSHSWLILQGAQRADVAAKLCAVDLRSEAFPLGAVAQTQAARVSVIIAHHTNSQQQPVFSLFVDQAVSEYLWLTLQDAMGEFI